MKRMVGMVSLGLVLLVPAFAASHQKTANVAAATSSQVAACAAAGRQLNTVSPEHVWRLRAFEDLDCALAILDEALKTDGSAITLSRHEIERARASVWSARDAAARIGR